MNVMPENVRQTRIYSEQSAGQRWSARSVVDVAIRRLHWVALSILACLVLAGYYLATTPDKYTATAVLMMDTRQAPASPSQLSQESMIDPSIIDSQLEILKSDRIAQRVVDGLRLASNPEFASGAPGLRARLVAWMDKRPLAVPTPDERRTSAVDALTHKVKITRMGHSYLAEIATTTLDRKLSARISNAMSEAYIQDQLDSRLSSNQRTVTWMNQRVAEVKDQADAAAAALALYRDDQAAALAARDPAALSRADELSAAADAARADFDSLQTRSLRLAQFIQQQTLPITEARVLTYADAPLAKSAPKSGVILLLTLVAGTLVGIGMVVAREALDRKLRSLQQIRSALGLTPAGIVPVVRQKRHGPALAPLFDARRPWCTATETFRSLKISVDHDARRTTGVVVGIVSPWPGEGKSTLTVNLARMLAEIGARVLVIDGDLKKPDLSHAVGSASGLGLVDLIEAGAALERCLERTDDGFDFIGHSGVQTPLHPFDVLGSRRMQAALSDARASHDYVLLDLPALLTSVDSQAVARFVDTFVLVAEYGGTTIDDVDRALATSEAISNRVVGVVLNKARGGVTPPRRRKRGVRRDRAAVSAS